MPKRIRHDNNMKMFKLLRLLALLVIVGLLLTQTNIVSNLLRPDTAYAVGDLTVDWGIGTGDVGPIFTVSGMAPGETQTHDVTVNNAAATGRPVGVKGVKTDETGGLADVMHIEIKDGATVLYDQTLAQFFTDSANPDGIPLSTVSPGGSKTFTFTVTFDENAGNEYQDTTVVFNIVIGIAVDVPEACEELLPEGKFPIFGTDGNDTIRGTTKADVIFALEGNDRVFGHGGNDCIIGGDGNDELRGETGNDFISGDDGADLLIGASGRDTIFGGLGGDTVRGEAGNDELHGEDGNDVVTGGNGNDTMTGGTGNDTMDGENGNDTLHGNADNDTLKGGNGRDTLMGDDGTDTANGHSGRDTCDAESETGCEL